MQETNSEKIAAALAIVHQAMAKIEALSDALTSEGAAASLRAMAERLYSDRRKRDEQFPPGLFGEPAWDLMLALFVANEEERALSLAQSCEAALVDPAAGPMLIDRMESEKLIARTPGQGGADSIRLTDAAVERLRDYLARMF